jgi:hypothetical protein
VRVALCWVLFLNTLPHLGTLFLFLSLSDSLSPLTLVSLVIATASAPSFHSVLLVVDSCRTRVRLFHVLGSRGLSPRTGEVQLGVLPALLVVSFVWRILQKSTTRPQKSTKIYP